MKTFFLFFTLVMTWNSFAIDRVALKLDCTVQIPRKNKLFFAMDRFTKDIYINKKNVIKIKEGLGSQTIDKNAALNISVSDYAGDKEQRLINFTLSSDKKIATHNVIFVFGGTSYAPYPALMESNNTSWYPDQGYTMGYHVSSASDGYLHINYTAKSGLFKREKTNLACRVIKAE